MRKLRCEKIVKGIVIGICIAFMLLSFVIDNIVCKIAEKIPETTISVEDMIKNGNTLKNFNAEDGGCLYKQDEEPWIIIDFKNYDVQNPKFLNLKIEELHAEYIFADVYIIDESYNYCSRETLRLGDNYINITDLPENARGIALDFWALNGDMIRISEIAINDFDYYAGEPAKCCRKIAIEIFIVLFLVELEKGIKVRTEKKKFMHGMDKNQMI